MQLCGREVVTKTAEEKELVLQKSVETLGVDLRTRTKQLGAKGKARRKKCVVSFSIARRNRVFLKNSVRVGMRTLLRTDLVLVRVWEREQAGGIAPTESWNLSRAF